MEGIDRFKKETFGYVMFVVACNIFFDMSFKIVLLLMIPVVLLKIYQVFVKKEKIAFEEYKFTLYYFVLGLLLSIMKYLYENLKATGKI